MSAVAAAATGGGDEDDADVAAGADGLHPSRDLTSGSRRSRMSDFAMAPMDRG